MVATLWSIKYSPWSVRARWALKVLKFEFDCLAYTDVLFREWRLRLLTQKWRVTVPALVDKKTVIMDGKEMIEYVEEQQASDGPRLVREGVEEWLELADVVMENERSRGLDTALSDDAALKGMVPPAMQWLFQLGPLGTALIRSQVRALASKYPRQYDEGQLKAALGKIGTGIQASSSGYLVGDSLSYADIACATAIETVRGTPGKHVVRFFPPHESLSCPLEVLLAWRDSIHLKHWVEGI